VEVEGEKLLLTKTEYSILLHLFLHKNIIVSHKELLSCLDEETSKDTLAINIHIFNLRKKIKNVHLIKTVPLYGFIIPGVFGSSGKV
jgi:DNA-binding response OmpR family regulator